mmetsp:Transcript_7118/g.24744  ORF Transcript_7118/g.24744 Transcript_7118/m.24744 type:complete len:277 (+) Transcript_7118:174-1004(+)
MAHHQHDSASAASGCPPSAPAGVTVSEAQEELRRSEKFFAFSPIRFVDDVYNCTSHYLKHGLDQMENVLLEDQETRIYSDDIKKGVTSLHKKLFRSLDRNIDKFELYIIRNILKIPKHLDLSSDNKEMNWTGESAAAGGSVEDEQMLDEELRELRRKIHSAQFVNRAMKGKLSEIEKQLKDYHQIQEAFDEMDRRAKESGVDTHLEAAVLDLLQHDPELRALEKQYAAVETLQSKDNENWGMVGPNIDTCFTENRVKMGGPSTRTLNHLREILTAK